MLDAVLFDLDGTLADTAQDLGAALNRLRVTAGKTPLAYGEMRPMASHGARGLLELGFGVTPEHPEFAELRRQFLTEYEQHLADATTLMDGMAELLNELHEAALPWGIVTNKPARYTEPLIDHLGLRTQTRCVVSGDTCPQPKPHPAPLLYAAKLLGVAPERCLYVGDAERDIAAGLAAGMQTAVVTFGYLGEQDMPADWGADHVVDSAADLTNLIKSL